MSDAATPQPSPQDVLDRFHSRRAEAVTQPRGSLALVNTQWVDSEQTIWGVPGVWAPRTDGGAGLTVTATASDGIRVDGQLVDGTATVRGKDDPAPSDVVFSDTVTGTVIPQEGGGSYALRVWDAESDGIRDFGGIDAFPFDPSWIVTADFTANPEGTTLGFEHLKDGDVIRDEVIPGSIRFSKDGVDYDLAAFQAGRALQLVFSDATSGDSTYSVGRFLFVAPKPDGTIVLDFNQAVLPPCAFSYAFNCPMPPKQNRFTVPIEAGEKNVVGKDGAPLH
jgi:uncharacterized protein